MKSIGNHPSQVTVTTNARLHLGFLDLNGSLGRRFGSIGVAIAQPQSRLILTHSAKPQILGLEQTRVESLLPRLQQSLGHKDSLQITLEAAIPSHQGLGSGTQLELALAAGLAAMAGSPNPIERALSIIDRGARSGIGIAAFLNGGFLLDGGHRLQERAEGISPPPILCRYDFPADWRFVLIFDDTDLGLHGSSEKQAFAQLSPMAEHCTSRLAQLVLMRLLPGLVELDFAPVADALTEIQSLVGNYFAPAQGGSCFSSPRIAKLLEPMVDAQLNLPRTNAYGIGQSSWGPTGFILVESPAIASTIEADLWQEIHHHRKTDPLYQNLRTLIVQGKNHGAEISLRF